MTVNVNSSLGESIPERLVQANSLRMKKIGRVPLGTELRTFLGHFSIAPLIRELKLWDFTNPEECKLAIVQAVNVSFAETERALHEALHEAVQKAIGDSLRGAFELIVHIFETHSATKH
jgi:hypothetical protein